MMVILYRTLAQGGTAQRTNFGGQKAKSWQVEGQTFDDVIICSNAQTLPDLIIQLLLHLSPYLNPLPFHLTFTSNNHSYFAFDGENEKIKIKGKTGISVEEQIETELRYLEYGQDTSIKPVYICEC